jgi:hypothetical protein
MERPELPDRIIREQARRSQTLRDLSDAAERAWWRLTTACDDHGRFDADPEVLLAELFKRRPSGWALAKMARAVDEWEQVGLVHRYGHDIGTYGHVLMWATHQRERDSKPKFPDPPCGGLPQLAAKCGESRQIAAYSERRETRDERRETDAATSGGDLPPTPAFQIPDSIRTALAKCPSFASVPKLSDPRYWQAQIRANGSVDFARELVKAQAWVTANPQRAPRKDVPGFLNRWFGKAGEGQG